MTVVLDIVFASVFLWLVAVLLWGLVALTMWALLYAFGTRGRKRRIPR